MNFHAETEHQAIKPVLLTYGGAEKAIHEMNEEELKKAQSDSLRRAREKAFAKGLPIHYQLNGKLVAEYPDGRLEYTGQ